MSNTLNSTRNLINSITNSEKLLLSQAVCKFGSSNWNLISEVLSTNPNLENDRNKFTSQFCSFIFTGLMQSEGYPDASSASLPDARTSRQLAHKFYVERVQELAHRLVQGRQEESALQNDIISITNGSQDDRILSSIPVQIREQILQQRQQISQQQQQLQLQQHHQQQQQQLQQQQSLHPSQSSSSSTAIASGSGTSNNRPQQMGTPIPSIPPPASNSTTKKPTTRTSRSNAIPIMNTSASNNTAMKESDVETGTDDDVEMLSTIEGGSEGTVDEVAIVAPSTTTVGKRGRASTVTKPRKSLRGKGGSELDGEDGENENEDEVMQMKEEEGEESHDGGEEEEETKTTGKKGSKGRIVAAANAAKRRSKRKTSEPADSSPPPADIKGKKPRLETEEIDENHPTTLTEKESKEATKRFKRSTTALLDRLSELPDAHHFKSPVSRSIAPNYNLAVKRPMCIKDVVRRVKEGILTTSEEVIRDVALIFANAVQYNGLNVKEGEVAMGIQAQAVWQAFEQMMQIQLNLDNRNNS